MAEILRLLEEENNNRSDVYLEEANLITENQVKSLIYKNLPELDITRVCTVHNNYLEGMYRLKKEEYEVRYGRVVLEKTMFHATSACKVNSIIKDNLDWRRVTRNKYGIGVSFSLDADYANHHSNRDNGVSRAFLVCSVLVGNTATGSAFMKIPPSHHDTAMSSNGLVYVKFSDNEFLPKYVVFYDAPDHSESKHYRPYRGRRRVHFW